MSVVSAEAWDLFLAGFPQAHILQSAGWGRLKSAFGWRAEYVVHGECGAQILFRRLPLGLTLAYLPKGPLGEDWNGLWPQVDALCRSRRAVLLKVEPDSWVEEEPSLQARLRGFRPGGIPVQPRRTVTISLQGSPEAWLERMKQKTRYNIRLAERKGVIVRAAKDLDAFYPLMEITGSRDGFGVHSRAYYQRAFDIFHPGGNCELLIAEFEGRPLAGLLAFRRGQRAWYFYGASNDEERSRMPTYLLQWEAMRWAAQNGCLEYDLWGVPDEDEADLEAQFETRHDGLWGVYRFKRGFGGQLRRTAQTYEKIYLPPLYALYRWYAARRGGAE